MVTPSSMNEKKFAKIAELSDRNVGGPCGLQTFDTTDTNANVSRLDHRNIVGTVTNSQKQSFKMAFNKFDNESLLKW